MVHAGAVVGDQLELVSGLREQRRVDRVGQRGNENIRLLNRRREFVPAHPRVGGAELDIEELPDIELEEPSEPQEPEADLEIEEPTEAEETLEAADEDELETLPSAREAEEPEETEEERPESISDFPEELKQDVKSVLSYLDQLLESLPENKIREFARSEYFGVYKRLFEELGLES